MVELKFRPESREDPSSGDPLKYGIPFIHISWLLSKAKQNETKKTENNKC